MFKAVQLLLNFTVSPVNINA